MALSDVQLRGFNLAIDRENSFINRAPQPDFRSSALPLSEYNALYDEDLTGFSPKPFMLSRSPEQTAWIKEDINRERWQNRQIEEAGGWGIAGMVAGAMSDPLNLAGLLVGPEAGLARVAAIEMSAAGLAEVRLQSSAYERELSETAVNVLAAGIVTIGLGGVAKLISPGAARKAEMAAKNDLVAALNDQMVPDAVVSSVGARLSADTTLEEEGAAAIFGSKKLAEWMGIGPGSRLIQSKSVIARRVADRLGDISFIRNKHFFGITGGPSVENVVRNITSEVDLLTKETELAYRAHKASGLTPMNHEEFGQAVSRAMTEGDVSQFPEVEKIARRWRELEVRNTKRAVDSGVLLDDRRKALKSMRSTYNQVFDADVVRRQKGGTVLAKLYFDAFQAAGGRPLKRVPGVIKGVGKGKAVDVTAAAAAEAGTELSEEALAAGVDVATEAPGVPVANKAMRDALGAKIAAKIEEQGFEGLPTAAWAKRMANDIAAMARGIEAPMYKGLPPDVVTASRQKAHKAIERDIVKTYQELSDEYARLAEVFDFDPTPGGAGPGGRLGDVDFDEKIELYMSGKLPEDDPSFRQVKRAGDRWRQRVQKARGLESADEVEFPAAYTIRTVGAESYFPRMYNGYEMLDKLPDFERDVREWLEANTKATAEEAESIASDMTKGIEENVNAGAGAEISPNVVGISAYAKNRTIRIPDSVLEPYTTRDPVKVWKLWTKSIGGRTALMEEFGDYEFSNVRREIYDDYQKLIEGATSGKERTALSKGRKQDMRDLEAIRDRLLGTYGRPQDAESVLTKGMQAVRLVNTQAMLGGAALSSVTDLARPIQAHGFAPFMKGFVRFWKEGGMSKLGHEELGEYGVGLVNARNSRFSTMGEINDIGKSLEWGSRAAHTFLRASGIIGWDHMIQNVAGYTALEGLARGFRNYAKMPVTRKARWARAGLGEDMAPRVQKQLELYGTDLRAWTDKQARYYTKLAVQSDVDNTVFKRTATDSPLLMSTQLGKTVFQFKSFVIAAHNKMLVAGLQTADMDYYMGMVVSTAIAAGIVYTKDSLRGRRPQLDNDEEIERFTIDSIARTGWLGFYEPIKDVYFQGRGYIPSKYAAQTLLGAVAGPAPAEAERVTRGILDALNGDLTYKSIASAIPWNNPAHLRDLAETVIGGTERNR